jgi:signal transduction histidine kinase
VGIAVTPSDPSRAQSIAEKSVRKTLRVLLVEDCEDDADLLVHELRRAGYDVIAERVQTADEMRAALQGHSWQIVLSDYSLPRFSGPAALAVLKETNIDLPFIMVSGTIGEDTAVDALKAGAADFLVKGRLARLVPAIERELREVDLRRERECEREVLEDQLRQSHKLEGIGRLAGGIAHDFNNLLTVIIGYTEMVLDQIGPDKPISQDLNEIRGASDRAVALTRQLLAFSRKQTLKVAATDLNEIIVEMRNMLQRLISEDIEIRLRLAPQLPPILTDRVQMEQVVMNLVMNARDAMPRGGVVSIETIAAEAGDVISVAHQPVAPGNYVWLRVTDTGVGMDAGTRARIFEPFFTTKGLGEGTGLGLATVYGVVQQLGGQIAVSSEVGRGTTFSLYFPEASEPAKRPPGEAPQTVHAPLATRREVVLVVEDQPAVRQLIARILTRHGYLVLEAADATQALAIADTDEPTLDLVVSDIVMPTMGGPELIARVRASRPAVKVLFISGYTEDDLSRRIDLAASDMVLGKPFTATALLQTVRDVLDRAPSAASGVDEDVKHTP